MYTAKPVQLDQLKLCLDMGREIFQLAEQIFGQYNKKIQSICSVNWKISLLYLNKNSVDSTECIQKKKTLVARAKIAL